MNVENDLLFTHHQIAQQNKHHEQHYDNNQSAKQKTSKLTWSGTWHRRFPWIEVLR